MSFLDIPNLSPSALILNMLVHQVDRHFCFYCFSPTFTTSLLHRQLTCCWYSLILDTHTQKHKLVPMLRSGYEIPVSSYSVNL